MTPKPTTEITLTVTEAEGRRLVALLGALEYGLFQQAYAQAKARFGDQVRFHTVGYDKARTCITIEERKNSMNNYTYKVTYR